MPSSLTVNLSSASVFSTRPPVSVSGTGPSAFRQDARVFSGACSSIVISRCKQLEYFQASSSAFPPHCLTLPFNALFRQCADVSLLRHRCLSYIRGCGILTACPSTLTSPLGLRSRLTLGRLALPRNPWSFGEGVSRPLCRYLYLHLLFRDLQRGSRHAFCGYRNAPLPISPLRGDSTSSAPDLCPIIIHAGPLD